MEKLKQIVNFIHSQGAVAGIQLAHAGRKASHASPWKGNKQIHSADGGWLTVAPSAFPFSDNEEAPAALIKKGYKKLLMIFLLQRNVRCMLVIK